MMMSGVQKWSTMSPRTLISPCDQSADEFRIIRGSGQSSLYVRRRLICCKEEEMRGKLGENSWPKLDYCRNKRSLHARSGWANFEEEEEEEEEKKRDG